MTSDFLAEDPQEGQDGKAGHISSREPLHKDKIGVSSQAIAEAEGLIQSQSAFSKTPFLGQYKDSTSLSKPFRFFKPEFLLHSIEAWEEDRAERFDLPKLNASFWRSVPVLKPLQWEITFVGRGYAETRLPLNAESSNQYLTIQAALQLLAADYTGGIALATLFHKQPIIGFHPVVDDNAGVYLWGGRADIKWLKPACGDLTCKASIPQGEWAKIVRRVNRHQTIAPKVKIDLFNGVELVGQVDFVYFAQDVVCLRRNAHDPQKIHFLYLHKTKATAKLIAGLRALEWNKPASERLCEDPCAELLAGKHGITLAQRFQIEIPELQKMVAARTKLLDETVMQFVRKNSQANIINIGAGYDARFWRLDIPNTVQIYELDLPVMLHERKKIFEYSLRPNVHVLPIDLRTTTVCEAIQSASSFDDSLPSLVIWEGGSMYFDKEDAARIFSSLAQLTTQHPESIAWLDCVTREVIDNKTGIKEIENFIRSMQEMGEPFINGFSDLEKYATQHNLTVIDEISCNEYLRTTHPVMEHYKFCTLRSMLSTK